MSRVRIIVGDCREALRDLEPESVQCVVTSPPYYGLRDYGVDGQIGLEHTPSEYVDRIVDVMSEVRRVLRDDGTLWINLGDSYAGAPGGFQGKNGQRASRTFTARIEVAKSVAGHRAKCLMGMPWRVALALIDDGWILRSDIIWSKPNPMPESVRDRPTRAHEYLFLFTKSGRYLYDADAIREPFVNGVDGATPWGNNDRERNRGGRGDGLTAGTGTGWRPTATGRNRRTVWTILTRPYHGAHFATFPRDLVEPCVLAGSRPGDVVLDPFAGSGTTLQVAIELGRAAIGIEISPDYARLIDERLAGVQLPLVAPKEAG